MIRHPFNVGVNVGLESANGLTGVFGILNASVYELPQGPVSVFGGVGLLDGVGLIGGASLDYAIPNQPIVANVLQFSSADRLSYNR